jgi:hypothetical protein
MPCSSHPEKNASKKQKKEGPVSLPKTLMVGGGERSRRTAFVTRGGLGAFLLLLAIVSVPQKNPSKTTVIVAVTCLGKKKD